MERYKAKIEATIEFGDVWAKDEDDARKRILEIIKTQRMKAKDEILKEDKESFEFKAKTGRTILVKVKDIEID